MTAFAPAATALLVAVLLPSVALAQASITGTVRDTSGAVLPGVTVEAASPVLIERVRTVVTDGGGQFRIVDLRPGTYAVTFTLPGFSVIRREGLELAGSFTATVNAELRVGTLEETLTVTAQAPIVDVQSAGQQQVLSAQVIDALPAARTPFAAASLIAAVQYITPGGPGPDVGGTNAVSLARLAAHGGRVGDMRTNVDGLSTNNSEGSGQFAAWMPNMSSTQEIAFDVAGGTAERPTGGVFVNVIPREGGNRVSGTFFANGTGGWQSSNYTQDLQDRGLGTPNNIQKIYDINGGVGGPLLRDRLWFYSAARRQIQNIYAGGFYNLNAGDPALWTYEPDLNRRTVNETKQYGGNGRLTWQVTPRNKVSLYHDVQRRTLPRRNLTSLNSPEAVSGFVNPHTDFSTATWSAPITSRLLVDAGWSHHPEKWMYPRHDTNMIGVLEQSTGREFRGQLQTNQGGLFPEAPGVVENGRASVSYVTGTHAWKVGATYQYQSRRISVTDNDYNLSYRFNNGIPNQLTQRTTPFRTEVVSPAEIGIFVQDRWTRDRLTLNLGARVDYFNTYFPEQHFGPSQDVPNRNFTFPRTEWASLWDLNPRVGAAYDVAGDGKTAVKVSVNRYRTSAGLNSYLGSSSNPANTVVNTVTRAWNDANRNFVPDCDLTRTLANGECGVVSNLSFGTFVSTATVDPGLLSGWSRHPDNWEVSAGMQREVFSGVSADVGYFRRMYGHFVVTDNRAVSAADFTPFSITAPADSRLPGGGGYTVSGLDNLNPDKVGRVDNFITASSNYGHESEYWHGVDATVNTRLRTGMTLQAGLSTGRTVTDNCEIRRVLPETAPTNPYCHVATAFLTQIKAFGSYTIPRIDVQTSATFQSLPGPEILANYVASNTVVAPSLGRNLSGGAANVTVNLVEPGTIYGDRINGLDVRVGKVISLRGIKTVFSVDVYNVMNVNPITSYNNSFARWQAPVAIWQARFIKLGAQFDF